MIIQLNLSNLFNIKRLVVITLTCFVFNLAFSQNLSSSIGSDGTKSYQMEVTKGNLVSFSKSESKKEVWARFNSSAKANHPEFGRMPFNSNYNGFAEVLDKRTIDERYFVNTENPSEFKVQKSLNALHYKVNNEWITINHHLADKGNGIYEATNQYDAVGLDMNTNQSYIKTPQGQVNFNNWKLYGETVDGKEEFISTANWSNYTVGDDGAYITDIFPGIDAQLIVNRGSVKTSFVVKQLSNTSYVNLLFKDAFIGPIASYLNFKDAVSNESKSKSEVDLLLGGKPVLEIGQAITYPENGTKEDYLIADYSIKATHLTITIPVNWIQKHIGSTRVIIDPLVTSSNSLAQASITGSMYNASCGFTNFCSYNLSVNTPANSTLTDVKWSFAYITGGICWLSDGANRFTTGACTSPSNAALYWYCNSATGGTCTGNNISIYNDVSSCLPAPSCAPVSVPFTMQFFRKCFGAVGCSGTCIGANSPWTMTLEGHTVEFTNTVTPFSMSNSTVCAGGNLTATSNGVIYGVPPRTLNWSFSPTGIPSVGTGNTPSINFPAAGAYTVYAIVTDACGVTATGTSVVNAIAIPTANAGINKSLTCAQTTTVLNGTGGGTYSWSGPGTITTPTSQNPTVNTPGVFSLIVNVAGCNSPAANVTVTQNTTAPVTSAGTSGSVTCSNLTINLTNTLTGATYTWTAPGGSSITGGVNNQNTTGSVTLTV